MGKGMKAGKKPSVGGGQASMQKQMQQVQAMQKKMEQVQAEIDQKEVTSTAGGGAVSVTVNGKKELVSVVLKKDVVDPDDVEMLQDLVLAAVNEALRQAAETIEREMGKMTGGLNMPGLF